MKVFEHLQKLLTNLLRVLCKTFWNFRGIITTYDCRHYIGQIWNEIENVYRNYEIVIGNVHFAGINKLF